MCIRDREDFIMSHSGNDAIKEQIYEQVLDEFPNVSEYECLKIAKYRYEDYLDAQQFV